MYVCVCSAVTDQQIRKAAASGARSVRDLRKQLGIAARCGSCKDMATAILRESRAERDSPEPVVYQPSPA